MVVSVTQGEAGQNRDVHAATRRTLGKVRAAVRWGRRHRRERGGAAGEGAGRDGGTQKAFCSSYTPFHSGRYVSGSEVTPGGLNSHLVPTPTGPGKPPRPDTGILESHLLPKAALPTAVS